MFFQEQNILCTLVSKTLSSYVERSVRTKIYCISLRNVCINFCFSSVWRTGIHCLKLMNTFHVNTKELSFEEIWPRCLFRLVSLRQNRFVTKLFRNHKHYIMALVQCLFNVYLAAFRSSLNFIFLYSCLEETKRMVDTIFNFSLLNVENWRHVRNCYSWEMFGARVSNIVFIHRWNNERLLNRRTKACKFTISPCNKQFEEAA